MKGVTGGRSLSQKIKRDRGHSQKGLILSTFGECPLSRVKKDDSDLPPVTPPVTPAHAPVIIF